MSTEAEMRALTFAPPPQVCVFLWTVVGNYEYRRTIYQSILIVLMSSENYKSIL